MQVSFIFSIFLKFEWLFVKSFEYFLLLKQSMGQDLQPMKAIKTGQMLSHPPLNIASHTNVIINQQFAKLIEYSLTTPSRQNCKRWEQQIKQYFHNVDTSLLYLPTRYHYRSTEYCGGAGIMNIYYQYYPITLQTEIASRSGKHLLFSQEQVWGLLYTICAAAFQLHAKDKKLGKVALEHVFINPENIRIKIATGLSFFSDTAVDQILAPESIIYSRGFINKNSAKHYHRLCNAANSPIKGYVNNKRPHQSLGQVTKQLRNQKSFSDQLKQIVVKMIDIDPVRRITPTTIIEHLQPYEQIIIGGSKPPSQTLTEILEENNQHNNRPSKLIRVTLGTPLRQFSNQEQQKSSYSKNIRNSIEKTKSQYVSAKQQKPAPNHNSLDQFLNMVDRHLENSRNSYQS